MQGLGGRQIVSRSLTAASVVSWLVPVLGFSYAYAFVRGTYQSGEEISPRDYFVIGSVFVGWCLAVITFIVALVANRKSRNRLALVLSAVYGVSPIPLLWLLNVLFNALFD